MQTVATRVVRLDIARAPTVADYVKDSVLASGTGGTITFTLPPNISAGDSLYVFLRYEDWPVDYDTGGTDNFNRASGDELNVETNSYSYPPPFPGVNLGILDRYATGDDAGREVTFTLKLYDSFGGSVIGDYTGPWQLACYVLDGDLRTATGTDTGVDIGWEWREYGTPDYYNAFDGLEISKLNELVFFVGVPNSSATFNPSTLPTLLYSDAKFYVGAKVYRNIGSIAASGMTFNCSDTYYIGGAFGIYQL